MGRLRALAYQAAIVVVLVGVTTGGAGVLMAAGQTDRTFPGLAGVSIGFSVRPSLTATRKGDSLVVRSNTEWTATLTSDQGPNRISRQFSGGPTGSAGITLSAPGRLTGYTLVSR
jgi:hypothetical protein